MADTTSRGAGAASDASSATSAGNDGEAGFDQIMSRLRGVVERLEAGSLGLELSLAAFEEGVRLARRGAEILDRAEQRVEVLTRGSSGGVEIAPLPTGEGDGAA